MFMSLILYLQEDRKYWEAVLGTADVVGGVRREADVGEAWLRQEQGGIFSVAATWGECRRGWPATT